MKLLSSSSVSSRQPGMLLLFIFISGAIVLSLSGTIERPAHGAPPGTEAADNDAAAPADEHEETGGGADAGDDHAGDDAAASEPPTKHDAEESHASSSILGVERDSVNLTYPRFVFGAVALTLVTAVGYALRPSVGLLVVLGSVSLVSLAASMLEARHAGEELGLFVPLPGLAAALYASSGLLATIHIAGAQPRHPHLGEAAH